MKPTISLLITAMLVAACRGGDELSAEEYFAAVESAAAQYDAATNTLLEEYTAAVGEASVAYEANTADADTSTLAAETAKFLDILVAEISGFFEHGADALRSFVATMSDLDPPADIEEAHAEAVSTLKRSLDAIPALVEELSEANSQGEIDEAINGSDFGDVQPRVVGACIALEALASAQGITADLHCGEVE